MTAGPFNHHSEDKFLQRSQIRVCHVSSVHQANDPRIFQKEAKSLAKAGYDVSFIVANDKAEVKEGIRIIPLPPPRNRVERLFVTSIKPLRLALRENAAVYHLHDPELLPIGIVLSLFGKKVVYDVHEDYGQTFLSKQWLWWLFRKPFSMVWPFFEKTACWFFDAIIACNTDICNKFPPSKSEKVCNFPPRSFSEIHGTRQPSDKVRVVYAGRLDKERSISVILEAMSRVQHDNVELHVLGWGDESLINAVKLHPRTKFHGHVSWREAREFLECEADIGLLLFRPDPALVDSTGEGNTKLFEYLAVGLPVLYSDFPKLRALVETIGGGFPVDPTDPDKIAAAIDHLADNPDLCRQMGNSGQHAVREQYNWEHEEEKLIRVYDRLTSMPH